MRNSSLVEWFCAENVTGLKCTPKLGLQSTEQSLLGERHSRKAGKWSERIKRTPNGFCSVDCGVGERRIRGEAIAEAVVDCIGVRMPE